MNGNPPKDHRNKSEIFFLKNENGLRVLESWLEFRAYNAFTDTLIDKKGNPMIGLSLEGAGKNLRERRGIIVCLSKDLHDAAKQAVIENMKSVAK